MPVGDPQCPACGYVVQGLSSPRCPECGRSIDLDHPYDRRPLVPRADQVLRAVTTLAWIVVAVYVLTAFIWPVFALYDAFLIRPIAIVAAPFAGLGLIILVVAAARRGRVTRIGWATFSAGVGIATFCLLTTYPTTRILFLAHLPALHALAERAEAEGVIPGPIRVGAFEFVDARRQYGGVQLRTFVNPGGDSYFYRASTPDRDAVFSTLPAHGFCAERMTRRWWMWDEE